MATMLRPIIRSYEPPVAVQPLRVPGVVKSDTSLDVPPRRQRSKRGEGDRLRDEILDAVDEMLMANPSPDAVSIRAVAEKVGCTPPAIYLHFFDKQELLFDVCARRFRQLNEAVDAAVNAVPPSEDLARLEAGVRAYIQFGLEYREHYRILFMGRSILTPEQLDELRNKGITGMDPLLERCRKCLKAGVVKGDDEKMMAFGLWSLAHGVVSLQIARPHVDWPESQRLVDYLIETHMRGLRR